MVHNGSRAVDYSNDDTIRRQQDQDNTQQMINNQQQFDAQQNYNAQRFNQEQQMLNDR